MHDEELNISCVCVCSVLYSSFTHTALKFVQAINATNGVIFNLNVLLYFKTMNNIKTKFIGRFLLSTGVIKLERKRRGISVSSPLSFSQFSDLF